jgi:hypothetical protein
MADDASTIARTPARGPMRPRSRTSTSPSVELFTSDTFWPWFERLRAEDPVHYCAKRSTAPTGR